MKKHEFSKLVLGAAVITWFAGAIFGACIVAVEHSLLNELLTYIGAPAATAFGFYYWKAKNENVLKIPKAEDEPESGFPSSDHRFNQEDNNGDIHE